MPKRLSRDEFKQRHSAVIDLAQKQHTMKEIAARTGKSPKLVSFLITTARQRGIDIPYKIKRRGTNSSDKIIQKRNVSAARQHLKKRLGELLGETHRPVNYKKILRMFAQGANVEVVANEVATQLNISNQKAYKIAQTIYYLRRTK